MNLEAIALMRAQEQYESGAWKRADRDDTSVTAPAEDGVVPLKNGEESSGRVCFRCGAKALTSRNTSNLCRECHFKASVARRKWYREAKDPGQVPDEVEAA